MRETAADLERLQALLDDSVARASPFLRSSFQMPELGLSAERLVARLEGSLTVALATVTARGEPRVAPVAAMFLRGSFHVPTVAESARARHVARRPGVSVTYFEGTDLAVVAHGRATIVAAADRDFAGLDAAQVACGNQSVTAWRGEGVYLRVEAASLFTFAR
jgi:hypothetical protein